MQIFAFVFSFEELNTNVFVNALMRTRSRDELFVAYCPKDFSPLFFSADLVIEIPDVYLKYSSYSEVSETTGKGIAEKLSQFFFSLELWFINRLQKVLHPKYLLALSHLLRTARTEKYLYKSGVYAWVTADARYRWSKSSLKYGKVIHVSDYFVVSPEGLSVFDSLEESFLFRFRKLKDALESGMRLPSGVRTSGGGLQKQVVMRTRNYSRKASVHNSDPKLTETLVRILLESGFKVVNVGSPLLSLASIQKTYGQGPEKSRGDYIEISSPPLQDELEIIMSSEFIITRADAGLFTLMSFVKKPLITISDEYSTFLGVSLLEARANSGQPFHDLALDVEAMGEFTPAGDLAKIKRYLGSSRRTDS